MVEEVELEAQEEALVEEVADEEDTPETVLDEIELEAEAEEDEDEAAAEESEDATLQCDENIEHEEEN